MATFSPWDYVVFSLVLGISAAIGIYFRFTGGKQKTTKEFLLANQNMSKWMVCVSLMTSFMSAVTILGVSAENYQYGTLFVIINLSYIVTMPIAAYIFLPVFFKLGTTSVYEYLGRRFGPTARLTASTVYLLQMILYMGIVLYAPALALEAVTGLNKVYAILILGFVCTFYSTIGGMKAVVFIDLFQSLLMFIAVFSVIVVAAIHADGLGDIWHEAERGGRIEFLNFDPDPTTRHTWWALIIGGTVTNLSLYGVNQVQVQRMQTTRNIKEAQKTLWLNLPILSLLSLSTSLSGLAIYYMYKDCDPVLEGRITLRDQVFPLFVIDFMGHIAGLAGLVVSGIFAASLSTISAALNSLAAVTLQDYVRPTYKKIKGQTFTEKQNTRASKILACLYGFLCIGMAFLAQLLGGILQAALTIFGVVGGPLLGLFSLGMLNTRPNQKGALTGLAAGLAMAFWIGFGGPRPPPKLLDFSDEGCKSVNSTFLYIPKASDSDDSSYFWLYRVSYQWYSLIGFLVTFIVGYIASFICELLKWDSNARIYEDKDKTIIKTDLFCPPLAKRLARKNERLIKDECKNGVDPK